GSVAIQRNQPAVIAKDALAGKLVLFYHSAHWCPPCRRFSKILKKFYEECRAIRGDVEVVFVSSDRSEQEMREYLSVQAGWYYLPFGHVTVNELTRRFGVSGIPTVVVVAPSGHVITTKGRQEIETRDSTLKLLNKWMRIDTDEDSPIVTSL
ncbi:hypothetical protein PMAYCL1PPCAC_16657, partial [Pristionchus mayeri]